MNFNRFLMGVFQVKRLILLFSFFLTFSVLNGMDFAEQSPQVVEEHYAERMRNCSCCYEVCPRSAFLRLECGHDVYCRDCLNHLVDNSLKEKDTEAARCFCGAPFTEQDIKEITNSPDKVVQFLDVLAVKRLASKKNIHYCTTPDCQYRYLYKQIPGCFHRVECPLCRVAYCANCGVDHDAMVMCGGVKVNLSKEDSFWLIEHTRLCPFCSHSVEKNGGCDQVRCSNCKNFFCFNCLEKDSQHHYCIKSRAPIQPKLLEKLTSFERFKYKIKDKLKRFVQSRGLKRSLLGGASLGLMATAIIKRGAIKPLCFKFGSFIRRHDRKICYGYVGLVASYFGLLASTRDGRYILKDVAYAYEDMFRYYILRQPRRDAF